MVNKIIVQNTSVIIKYVTDTCVIIIIISRKPCVSVFRAGLYHKKFLNPKLCVYGRTINHSLVGMQLMKKEKCNKLLGSGA